MKNEHTMFDYHGSIPPVIRRKNLTDALARALRRSRVVALVGPRQSGKTTLGRSFVPAESPNYFDLEDPVSLARLGEPRTALGALRGIVVIDEIQRRPDLFPVLRVLADRRPGRARFLVLGSASPELLRQTSESLAGRIETLPIAGFGFAEVGTRAFDKLWNRGGFPRAFLARSDTDSLAWRTEFIRTLLERDVPQLGSGVAAPALLRFWTMLAHYHGQVWSAAEPARSLAVSQPTVRRYLDLLTALFMVRQLQPWHANVGKRQVKAPKVYLRDTGLLHQLLGIRSHAALLSHPKCGASWEGFVIEEALRAVQPDEHYFWATHQGAELDLLMIKGGRRIGVEVKRADAPTLTPSMRIALADLDLAKLVVIYPGTQCYALTDRVTVLPVRDLMTGLR